MLKIRDAKPLLALTVALGPWDYFVFTQDVGWALAFAWGRFVASPQGIQYLFLHDLYGLRSQFSPVAALYLWLLAGVLALLTAGFVLYARYSRGTTSRSEDHQVGAAFALAGGLYLASRLVLFGGLPVGGSVYAYSIPLGAVWAMLVGAIFYFDLFRAGA